MSKDYMQEEIIKLNEKLNAKDNHISSLKHDNCLKDQQITDIEAKLADAEKCVIDFQNKNTELEQDIAELQTKHVNLFEYSQKLEHQLAEKEKEYQVFKKIADENVNYLKNRIMEETRNYNQDKISFCIEKLEQLKEKVSESIKERNDDRYLWMGYLDEITHKKIDELIDNQIKELKEE